MTTSTPDWFEQGRRLVAGLLDNVGAPHQHGSHDDPAAASSCPLCAARATWRERRPDLLEGLADVLASTAEVLRASATRSSSDGSAAGGSTTPPDDPAPAEETVTEPAPTPSSSPVQRIDVA